MSAYTDITSPGPSASLPKEGITPDNSRLAILGNAAVQQRQQQQQQQQQRSTTPDNGNSFDSSNVFELPSQSPVPFDLQRWINGHEGRMAELESRTYRQEQRVRKQAATIVEQGEKLEQMAALIAENQQLRSELDTIRKRNAELEALVHQSGVPSAEAALVAPPVQEESMVVDDRRDTWGSKHAPTEEAYAAEAPLRAQRKAAAEQQQQQ